MLVTLKIIKFVQGDGIRYMNTVEMTQYRMTELIEELNSCRDDERKAQSQILEVISLI